MSHATALPAPRRTRPLLTALVAAVVAIGGAGAAQAATPTESPSPLTTPTTTPTPTPSPAGSPDATPEPVPAPTAQPEPTDAPEAPRDAPAATPDATAPADAVEAPTDAVTMNGATALVGNVDALVVFGTHLTVRGWAVDPSAASDPWVFPVVDDEWPAEDEIAELSLPTDGYRTDVQWYFPGTDPWHGFSGGYVISPGTHEVCMWAYSESAAATPIGCRVVVATTVAPTGNLESVTSSGSTVSLSGWAVDPDGMGPFEVHLYVNGRWGGLLRTSSVRHDIIRAYPGTGDKHGFAYAFTAGVGTHQVCAYAIDTTGSTSTAIGCRSVTVANRLPLGNFEALTADGSTVTLRGWALDPDVPGPIDVHYYVNGRWGGIARTDVVRADVANAYPGTGTEHGFTRSFTAGPGTHQVCAYAIDPAVATSAALGCRTVTVAGPPANRLPLGNFEALTADGSTVTLRGWALDPDVPGPIDVHYYVNGRWGGIARTDVVRADVANAYPGTGTEHGFTRSFTAGPGTHQVCAYAIDPAVNTNGSLGCRTVTVS